MQAKILERRGEVALVEWSDVGGQHRAILPIGKVPAGRGEEFDADAAELQRGIPYGVPWEILVQITSTPQQIARLLRGRGIWTEEDLQRNVGAVKSAFMEAYTIDFSQLLDRVRSAREQAEGGN